MEIRRLPDRRECPRRYAAELWLPYHRDLAAAVDAHALADWPDERFVERNVEFTRKPARRRRQPGMGGGGVPDDAEADPATVSVTHPDLELTGLLLTSVDECPDPFDRSDRLVVGEIYVAEPYRGTGLADRLMERAAADAREQDCGELGSTSTSITGERWRSTRTRVRAVSQAVNARRGVSAFIGG